MIIMRLGYVNNSFMHSIPMQAVSREIRKILTERANNFNIALDDVSITSLSFGKEFTHAIEAKQVAAQEAERAKFIVEKAEQDKRSAVIRAQVSGYTFWYKHVLGLTCNM
jgi:regulator of protease activity HflC (stomatin/prohibitin superfamily)